MEPQLVVFKANILPAVLLLQPRKVEFCFAVGLGLSHSEPQSSELALHDLPSIVAHPCLASTLSILLSGEPPGQA